MDRTAFSIPAFVILGVTFALALAGPVRQRVADNLLRGCPDVSALAARTGLPHVFDYAKFRTVPPAKFDELDTQCNQTRFLAALFREVTRGQRNDEQKAIEWVKYLQDTTYQSCVELLDEQGVGVYHPGYLLEKQGMQCGQVSRVAVDAFNAAGFNAHLVQLNAHQGFEVLLNGKWRYLETTVLNHGEVVRGADGEIASIQDIVRDPSLLDQTTPHLEHYSYSFCRDGAPNLYAEDRPRRMKYYREIFEPVRIEESGLDTPYIIKKTATPEQLTNRYYGWDHYDFCTMDESRCVRHKGPWAEAAALEASR